MTTNNRALLLLDFCRIREDVAGYCRSDEGRDAVLSSLPETEAAAVDEAKARARAVRELFLEGRALPEGVFPPIAGFLNALSKEGVCLEQEELYALALWSEGYEELRGFLAQADHPGLAKEAAEAPDISEPPKAVFRILARDGTLNDLPELREAQARVRRVNVEIERITSSFFQDGETRAMLQSDTPTQRDGRTVLAVRANFKARIPGIVHEVSDTGRTVFIEPESLVRKNNELVEAEAKYRQEVFRILKETTARVAVHLPALLAAREVCAAFDALWARARYSTLNKGVFAQTCERSLALARARHPMLGSGAVPIDLALPEDVRTLVITGPNTGGKTVSLKTVGLLCLMNQFALAVPADEGTMLPVLDGVYADIGDEQSIDQSLSTFSGHMKAMSEIVRRATSRSLVLLDELGSGTDPEEGCAIAMSLLDHFIELGCLAIVTTHHGILKNYGYTRAGVLNASADFDKNTLSPTYRIIMGIPGESRALDIAARNGLPPAIVSGARRYLAEERTDVAAMIQGLSEKRRELETLEEEQKRRIREAMEDQRKADLKALQLRQKETELREHGIGEMRKLLAESRRSLENLVREIREGELTPEKTKAVKEFIGNLEETVRDQERVHAERFAPQPVSPEEGLRIEEGSAVLVGEKRKRGRVIRRAKKGYWLVETGSLRVTVPESELQACREEKAEPPKVSVDTNLAGGARAAWELDLRGYRLGEALKAVEQQLEAASLTSLSMFSIIHGTGEGILGRGIHELLRNYPAVQDYYFARPEEGGFGKTIVQMKG
jgi:DNA mismatch repair protein MutS2